MAQPEPRRITVRLDPPCEIVIGPGVARELPRWLRAQRLADRYALITDTNVETLHAPSVREALESAGLEAHTIVVPAGEAHKTRATKERIEDALAAARIGRDGALLALGGGVVGDLAGFTAATWNRGVPYVQIPTTLLAMVDSSVGGKTGVDIPAGKNLVGAFHQPRAVFADTDFLATLPGRELRSGIAEVVKCGVIADAALLGRVASFGGLHGSGLRPAGSSPAGDAPAPRPAACDAAFVAGIIADAVAIKAAIVQADEREGDRRQILNFGHTIGHALETLSGYALSHGEAVSIGMVAEARCAVRMGLLAAPAARAIEEALAHLGLPVRVPAGAGLTPGTILDAARTDKKVRAGALRCALPSAIGAMARADGGYGIALDETAAIDVLSGMAGPVRPAPDAGPLPGEGPDDDAPPPGERPPRE